MRRVAIILLTRCGHGPLHRPSSPLRLASKSDVSPAGHRLLEPQPTSTPHEPPRPVSCLLLRVARLCLTEPPEPFACLEPPAKPPSKHSSAMDARGATSASTTTRRGECCTSRPPSCLHRGSPSSTHRLHRPAMASSLCPRDCVKLSWSGSTSPRLGSITSVAVAKSAAAPRIGVMP